ncbi:glycoside hydrolase family 99-like domain-containing protein, partial [Marivita sp.]|uniref:glycosyltransferase WbsX family protein n=1 Tax=Marivita sp. TaxID=2003365 RepID=UPI0025C1CC96
NPLFHYLTDGFRERRNPHILFDSEFYSAQAGLNPDCDPLLHYLDSGWREGHDPHPLFSSEWYISNYPATEELDLAPLLHFVEAEGEYEFDPGPWFSSREYHERYPQSLVEEPNALLHYLRFGVVSGNKPAAWFNGEAYLQRYADIARSCSLRQAFGHFIRNGQSEGRDAGPMTQSAGSAKAQTSRSYEAPSDWEEGAGTSEFVTERNDTNSNPKLTEIVAWYLPQFHPIPENDHWWGEGFTEWRNVTRGIARFPQHYQPRRPDALGYYDLRVPQVLERQVELANKYGVSAFCFHYYWFGGKQVLDLPLRRLLADKSLDIGFCVSWANENWTRTWDGLDTDVLLRQQYSAEDDIEFIDRVMTLFEDKRYLRIDGKPILIVYRPSLLPDAKATAERWRARCREKGVGELLLGMVQFDGDNPHAFGFDVAVEFPPHKVGRELPRVNEMLDIRDPEFKGTVYSYDALSERGRSVDAPQYPLIRGVCPSWDNEARRPGKGTTYHGSTPDKYGAWLEQCCAFAHQYPVYGSSLVFVNAWNEWAEAAYLEPDRRFGYAYLEVTLNAAEKNYHHCNSIPRARKILIVTHDMHNHGAQQLAYHIVQTLREHFSYQVVVLSLGPGDLWQDFEKFAKIYDFQNLQENKSQIHEAKKSGYSHFLDRISSSIRGRSTTLPRRSKVMRPASGASSRRCSRVWTSRSRPSSMIWARRRSPSWPT